MSDKTEIKRKQNVFVLVLFEFYFCFISHLSIDLKTLEIIIWDAPILILAVAGHTPGNEKLFDPCIPNAICG